MSKVIELPIIKIEDNVKPTDLYLDIAKWRCGEYSNNQLGEGDTFMSNEAGYMCCLGQFAYQLGIKKKELLKKTTPRICSNNILLTEKNIEYAKYYEDTLFSLIAMKINDDSATTPKEKVAKLTQHCKDNGVTLHIIDNDNLLDDFKPSKD